MAEYLKSKKKAVEELGIDESVFDELLSCFIPEADEEMRKLDEAIGAGRHDRIAEIGHGLKGMAGNLRIISMQTAAKAMEVSAKETKNMQEIKEKAVELKQNLAEIKLWIK